MQKAPCAKCDECPLRNKAMVPSYIPVLDRTDLLIISDRPGMTEVFEGIPLVGPAGQALDQILEINGIDPQTVSKTNAVLCLPPENDPPQAAIDACLPRLKYDIARSKATKIAACGAHAHYAINSLIDPDNAVYDDGIMKHAGKVKQGTITWQARNNTQHSHAFSVVSTVNPAYLLHNDAYAPNFQRHIARAIKPYHHIFDAYAVEYTVMDQDNAQSIIEYIESLPRHTPMAFDVETDHLQIWDTPTSEAAVFLCAVFTFDTKHSYIIPANMFDFIYSFYETESYYVSQLIESWLNCFHVIAHNGKFDQNVMQARYQMKLRVDDDTLAMHYALQEIGKHGLKDLVTEYLGTQDYEDELITSWFCANGMAEASKRRYSALPKDRLYRYAAIDGAATFALWELFTQQLKAENMFDRPYRETFIPVINALAQIEQNGFPIDRDQIKLARKMFQQDYADTEAELNHMVLALVYTYDQEMIHNTGAYKASDGAYKNNMINLKRLMTKGKNLRYNPNSAQQTAIVIYTLLGLYLTKRLIKPTGTNTGDEALTALNDPNHPFIKLLRHARHVTKMLNTYVESIDRRADTDDVLHVDFKFHGTEIGRLSANNGDHGIPRPDDDYGAMIRSLFIAKPGEVLILADFSQAELRCFALLANVQFLLDKYRNKQDVHDETCFMLEKQGAQFFKGFALLHEWKKKLSLDNRDNAMFHLRHTPTALAEIIPAIDDPVMTAYHGWHAGNYALAFEALDQAQNLVANTHKKMRTTGKNVNFGGLVYRGGAHAISGMIGGHVSPQDIDAILKHIKPLMPESDIYAESQYQLLRKQGYVETIFGRRRRFAILGEHNEDEARKAVVHMVVAGTVADLNNIAAQRLVDDHGIKVCHLMHDMIAARVPVDHADEYADIVQRTMIGVAEEFLPGIPWGVDIDRRADGSYPTRWVDTPAIPEKYR